MQIYPVCDTVNVHMQPKLSEWIAVGLLKSCLFFFFFRAVAKKTSVPTSERQSVEID